jgi:multiple sugar transport system substrate-binding protein
MTDVPNGSIGLADATDIINWYPAAANERFGWYSWDGGKLNLNSQEFVDGVKLARSVTEGGQAFSALPADQKLQMQHASDFEAWNAGAAALKFDGTWAINDHAELGFQTGFLGIPGGRACIVPDFLFLSKSSDHPAEAYAFAKFMSAYSSEGFAERLKLAKASDVAVTTIPIMDDRRMINSFFEQMPIPGVREVYDSIQKGSYVEGTKVLPGYSQARWEYVTSIAAGGAPNAKIGDVLAAACTGALDIEAVAGQLNSAANECIQFFPRQADN